MERQAMDVEDVIGADRDAGARLGTGCTPRDAPHETPDVAQRATEALAVGLRAAGLDVIALDGTGDVAVSTFADAGLERDVVAFLRARQQTLAAGDRAVMSRAGHRLSIAVGEMTSGGGASPLKVFTVRETRARGPRAGIEWLNAEDVRARYDTSAYGIVEGEGVLSPTVEECHARGGILMLEGEAGAGKRATAELVYLRGPYAGQPFVSISCDELSERGWRYLLKSSDSPFFDEDLTIYIGGLQALDDRRVRELAATLGDTGLSTRCRLLLAGDDVPGGGETRQMTLLGERLRCAVCIAPALHEQGNVSAKVGRYLGYLAEEFGTDAPRIDPAAASVLDGYRWPRNYLQLREVAERLYIMVGPGTVTAEIADEVLAQEEVIRTAVFNTPTLDTDLYILRPLADTDRDIARLVLERMEGNRTRTAEVLGISRTTLWRLLK